MTDAQTIDTHKGLLEGLFAKYAEAKVEHFRRQIFSKTVRQLEKLNDIQLTDIGIPREQIRRRAYHSVYHNAPYQQ
ncbi:DUF1127 domain-containing protein [Ruegeria sp. HKCCSP351]|uniref:DUF1127 domain-containing protein n=1 Tax=Ruegeria sp. HKCCSP351 TaxID=2794832 RepID=UPI001AE7A063|nr:DUF1127 domain-containing protein [Ruegeria sp. HKCCSP351]